jgi:hypothetical protein
LSQSSGQSFTDKELFGGTMSLAVPSERGHTNKSGEALSMQNDEAELVAANSDSNVNSVNGEQTDFEAESGEEEDDDEGGKITNVSHLEQE